VQILRNMTISAVLLGLFAILGTGLVALTFKQTKERIAENERLAVVDSLHALITPTEHDNDLYQDVIQVRDAEMLGSEEPINIYRARSHGQPVAAIIAAVAPDGYAGPIKLLVAVRYDGTLAGVRVVSHRETPGLGDGIERERSDWILGFNGKSLFNPATKDWKVKRDGGIFDQLTGATITPRVVVQAVYKTLLYYNKHRDEVFKQAATPQEESAS
jgi:electron transport complex protein RnfG